MKTSSEITETYSQQSNNSQHLRTIFEAQFDTQAQTRNDLAKKPLFRYLCKKLVNKADVYSATDIAQEEAYKINNLANFVLSSTEDDTLTSQQISQQIINSSEFGIKTAEEIFNRELLADYCPDLIDLIYSGDIDIAVNKMHENVSSHKPKKFIHRLKTAIQQTTKEVVETAINTNNQSLMVKLLTQNELRNIGYFKSAAKFPKKVIELPEVQNKLTQTLIYCLMFEYPNAIEAELSIVKRNKLIPLEVVDKLVYTTKQKRSQIYKTIDTSVSGSIGLSLQTQVSA